MTKVSKGPKKVKVLFVAANPIKSTRLALDEEIREISQKVLMTEHRDLLDIQPILAARPGDLLQAFNMYRPHVVHFSGHGSPGGLLFSDQNRQGSSIGTEALKALFTTLKDNIRVVLLNACYSQRQAEAITEVIDCAIGMSEPFNDNAAITFSAAFYQAIGFGRSIQEAFEQGKVALRLENIAGHETPVLLVRQGIDASRVYIIPSKEGSATRENAERLQNIEELLLYRDYDTAYREIDTLLKSYTDEMPPHKQAKLKYLEALVHLEGKRPFVHTPSIIQLVDRLLSAASKLEDLYSYRVILATFKYDFARNGFPLYEVEANKLISKVQSLSLQDSDRTNLALLSQTQPDLFRDYQRYFKN